MLPVMPGMCATCPFREDGRTSVRALLIERALSEASPICHSTGKYALTEITGKPAQGEDRVCRGARNIQIEFFHQIGFLREPTEEAWMEKAKELGLLDDAPL